MFKLTISRKEWWRGKPNSKLLLSNGQRCCIGIYGKAIGVPDDVMSGRGAAMASEALQSKFIARGGEWLMTLKPGPYYDSSDTAWALMRVNDKGGDEYSQNTDDGISETERETIVAALFAKHDVEVTFTD